MDGRRTGFLTGFCSNPIRVIHASQPQRGIAVLVFVNGFDSIEPDSFAPNDLTQTYVDRLHNSDVAIVPSLLDR